MAKLRHIAINVADLETSAAFFERAFDMKRVAQRPLVIYLSDGTVNLALVEIETEDEKPGLAHFGMWVDDLAEAEKKVTDAGATYLGGRPASSDGFYERKYSGENNIVFDLSDNGWAGAVKDVVPAKPNA
jgi:methylmalonyl-CoA/ethylmalonyl-CoA epimerase